MEDMIIIETNALSLDLIQPLWEKLNQHIMEKSCFRDHYANFTFSQRTEFLLKKSSKGDMHVVLVKDKKYGNLVAYCVTTISPDNQGEIDSIYVEEKYRGRGVGEELMKRSLGWLDKNSVQKKTINVSFDNQEVVSFYERFGFRPRSITLELPTPREG